MKERYSGDLTKIADGACPCWTHRPGAGPGLSAADHPMQPSAPIEIQRPDRGLITDKSDHRGSLAQDMPAAIPCRLIFDRHAEPDVLVSGGPIGRQEPSDIFGALGEQLPIQVRGIADHSEEIRAPILWSPIIKHIGKGRAEDPLPVTVRGLKRASVVVPLDWFRPIRGRRAAASAVRTPLNP